MYCMRALLLYLRRLLFAIKIVLVLFTGAAPIAAAQEHIACPSPAPAASATVISHQMFDDVCIPSGFAGNPIAFFDDFSWRAFLALVWPAKEGQRGKPDPALSVGATDKPTVFETFKSEWEVFQPNGAEPSAWNSYAGKNPCNIADLGFGDVVLAAFSKFTNIGMAGFGPRLTGALIAQNRTYARYAVGFDENEFNTILATKAYLRSSLSSNIAFPNSSVDVKSAWMVMTRVPNPERFYTRKVWLLDLETDTCAQITVALVGLHIVVKTASRPQWIWITFEHRDNVPASDSRGPFNFNDGKGTSMPVDNPARFPVPAQPPAPYNVDRVKPLHASTTATNTSYQQALKTAGSVWQFYQLVMTQWPIEPFNVPGQSGAPNHTFPGAAPTDATAFSNTTMETFEQADVRTGCMNCHNLMRTKTDFLWTVMTRAHPSILQMAEPSTSFVPEKSPQEPAQMRSALTTTLPADQLKALEDLRDLIETDGKN